MSAPDAFKLLPGPDGSFRFEGPLGSHPAPSDREQLKAEAIQRLGLQEADDVVRGLLDSPSKQTNATK